MGQLVGWLSVFFRGFLRRHGKPLKDKTRPEFGHFRDLKMAGPRAGHSIRVEYSPIIPLLSHEALVGWFEVGIRRDLVPSVVGGPRCPWNGRGIHEYRHPLGRSGVCLAPLVPVARYTGKQGKIEDPRGSGSGMEAGRGSEEDPREQMQ